MHTDLISRLQNARTGIHIASAIGTDKALLPAINELLDVAREAEIALAKHPKPAEGGAMASAAIATDELIRQVEEAKRQQMERDRLAEKTAATAGSGEAVATVTHIKFMHNEATIKYDGDGANPPFDVGAKLYAGAPPAAGQGEALELTEELRWILGQPNFTCIHTANALRRLGYKINPKVEEEQAAVIHWCLCLYLKHGDSWREEGVKILESSRRQSGAEGV